IRPSRRRPHSRPPRLEALEERRLLSTVPQLLKDIDVTGAGSGRGAMVAIGGAGHFVASGVDHGKELWRRDGPAAGTGLVADIPAGCASSALRYLAAVVGVLFFAADDETTGRELWRSDGTAAGTALVKDISPGPYGSNPRYLTAVGGELF